MPSQSLMIIKTFQIRSNKNMFIDRYAPYEGFFVCIILITFVLPYFHIADLFLMIRKKFPCYLLSPLPPPPLPPSLNGNLSQN